MGKDTGKENGRPESPSRRPHQLYSNLFRTLVEDVVNRQAVADDDA